MENYLVVFKENFQDIILIDRIKRYKTIFQITKNSYVIKTNENEIEIYENLNFDKQFHGIVIVKIDGEHFWGIYNMELWDFLKKNE